MINFRGLVLAPLLLGGCVVGPDYAGPPGLDRAAPQSNFVRQTASTSTNDPVSYTHLTLPTKA